MEKVMTNGFCELNEQEMMETDGGVWWMPAVIVGLLGAVGVGAVVVSVGNWNNRVNAQEEANDTKKPVVAQQWFTDDVTMYPKKDLLEQALSY